MFAASIRKTTSCRSVILVDLLNAKSMLKTHGALNMRRCNCPNVAAPGWKKTCPLKAGEPSAATARPSVPIHEAGAKYGPFGVMRTLKPSKSCALVRLVLAVLVPDWPPRFSVPRPLNTENGAPDCLVKMPLTCQPDKTLSSG